MFSTIAKLFSANLLVQVIPFLCSPLFAYLYELSVFGVFATVVSIAALIGCFASGKLELALIIASSDKAASVVASCANVLILLFAFATTFVLLVLSSIVALETPYYFIPILLIVSSSYLVFIALANRKKQYKLIIRSRLAGSLTRNALMLAFGVFEPSVYSLLSGYLLGVLLELVLVVRIADRYFPRKKEFAWCVRRYKRFFKITTSSSFLENITSTGLPALFNFSLGEKEAGAIAMAQRLLEKPVGALSGAVSEVFKVSFQKDYVKIGDKKKIYRRFLIGMFLLGVLPLLIGLMWGQQIVLLILGEDWGLAARYVEVLLPVYFLSFVVGSISSILFAFDKLFSELLLQMFIALGVLTVFFMLPTYFGSKDAMIKVFTAVMSTKYLAMLYVIELAFVKKLRGK